MSTTIKLYDRDSHLTTCQATVLSCDYDTKRKAYAVQLDQTVFFPEGGGQFADLGTMTAVAAKNSPAVTVRVLDVQITDDVIIHYADSALETGTLVLCQIDWQRRLDFMQQHSAEHIVSGLVFQKYGYHNVGFHLGLTETTLDFDGSLTGEQLAEVEQLANEAIYHNIAFQISFPDTETLAHLPYRSKKELSGDIRIVTLPGYDICACCAPHVYHTGEIGIVKITSFMAHRGGSRLTILCGSRALADYRTKQCSVEQISALLSSKQPLVADAVAKVKHDQLALTARINSLQKMVLDTLLLTLPSPMVQEDVYLFATDLDTKAIRDAVNELCTRYKGYCAIFVGNDETGYRFVIGSSTKDCRKLSLLLKEKLGAKSGGSQPMIQGNVVASEAAIKRIL